MRRLKALNATARDLLNGRSPHKIVGPPIVAGRGDRRTQHHHDTYALVRGEPLRAVTLTLFLAAVAEHCGADLLRLKGIVNILESPERPAVIHANTCFIRQTGCPAGRLMIGAAA